MDIQVVKQKDGKKKVYLNGTDVSDKCVGVDSFSDPGEEARVVLTYLPDTFTVKQTTEQDS